MNPMGEQKTEEQKKTKMLEKFSRREKSRNGLLESLHEFQSPAHIVDMAERSISFTIQLKATPEKKTSKASPLITDEQFSVQVLTVTVLNILLIFIGNVRQPDGCVGLVLVTE